MAIPIAIGVMVLGLAIIIVIGMQAMQASDKARSSGQDKAAQGPADEGAGTYLRGLNAKVIGEFDGFQLTSDEAKRLLGNQVEVIGNSSLPGALGTVDTSAATGVPPIARYTVKRDLGNDVYGYWQLYSMARPDWRQPSGAALDTTTGSRVVAYFRGWTADAGNTTPSNTKIIRAEFRPGRFADYFMIADGEINLDDGATIDGPVHSNGLPDQLFGGSLGPSDPRIYIGNTASCKPGAQFSVAMPSGGMTIKGGCSSGSFPKRHTPDKIINLKGIAGTSEFAWSLCGSAGYWKATDNSFAVRCVTRAAAGSLGTVNVGSLPGALGAPSVVLVVDGDVHVRGSVGSNRRVSVIAHGRTANVGGGTAGNRIYIDGNVGHASSGSLGLMAGGDIIVRVSSGCPVTSIQAALVSSSGSITYPTEWRIPVLDSSMVPSMPRCGGTLTINGSLAVHYLPTLGFSQGGSLLLGWNKRSYSYDRKLYNAPPPLMPLTTPWQHDGYDEASKRCFSVGGVLTSPECR